MGGDDPRTLIIDEADTIWGTKKTAEQNEDLRGLVNAGFERGRPTLRYNAALRAVEELETFGFVALAGIGALPDTITDRAVNLVVRRRKVGEKVEPYRSRRDGEPLGFLRDRLHAWVTDHLDDVEKADPDMPIEDRAADVWESLVIVADLAGGDWPRVDSKLRRSTTKPAEDVLAWLVAQGIVAKRQMTGTREIRPVVGNILRRAVGAAPAPVRHVPYAQVVYVDATGSAHLPEDLRQWQSPATRAAITAALGRLAS